MYFSLFSNTSQFGHDGGYQTIGDVFKNGGTYAIVGYLTVFAVLAIIWGVLELFHLVSNGKRSPPVLSPQPSRFPHRNRQRKLRSPRPPLSPTTTRSSR